MKTDLTPYQIIGQGVFYCFLIVLLSQLTTKPTIIVNQADETTLKLVIRHSGKILGKCEPLSKLKQDNLPTNMQRLVNCPREKSAMDVELKLNNKIVYKETIIPSGIHNDGVLAEYISFTLKSGKINLEAKATTTTQEGEFIDNYKGEIMFTSDKIVILHLDDSGFDIEGQHPS